MSDGEEQGGTKVRGRPFRPGNKYGRGRPRGSRNKATGLFQKTLERYAESLAKKLVQEAFQGTPTALRLCIERSYGAAALYRAADASSAPAHAAV